VWMEGGVSGWVLSNGWNRQWQYLQSVEGPTQETLLWLDPWRWPTLTLLYAEGGGSECVK